MELVEAHSREVLDPPAEQDWTLLLFKRIDKLLHTAGQDVLVAFEGGWTETAIPSTTAPYVFFDILYANEGHIRFCQRRAFVC